VRSPVQNGLSRSSMSEVSSLALSASVRATSTVGTSHDVGREARRDQRADELLVGTSTLPPRWPHFFSLASWSSKCTPAAPASIMAFISSKALSGPPKPASASATIGANQSILAPPLGVLDLVGALQRVVDALDHLGTELAGTGSGRGTSGPAMLASAATCQPER
jgi:hypothetical protein